MKTMIRILISGVVALALTTHVTVAQKFDEERMKRDVQVAENVLSTLIKQQLGNQRTFFPLEIKGSYQSGYGVTFALPADYTTPIAFSVPDGTNNVVIRGNDQMQFFHYNFDPGDRRDVKPASDAISLSGQAREKRRMDMDSVRDGYNQKVIDAAKMFIVDYGDMITQLGANERIVITNQGNQPRAWVGYYFNAPKRTHLSIEGNKADVMQYKQGKLNREQALAKIKVINTETVDTPEPDLELLSSIFNRLYRADLSKTYFIDTNIYFERLKDFGVIFYMQVYSTVPRDYGRFSMPTLGLNDIDENTRNKKVTELYPKFEQELKENILEYGRTLKSLKDDEVLVFQVTLTKCISCGIPSALECTVKGSVLKDFSAGKMDKKAALEKLTLKKGANQ